MANDFIENLLKQYVDVEIVCTDTGLHKYNWNDFNHNYKAYLEDGFLNVLCSLGHQLSDNLENRTLLCDLLKFNLKRMRFLNIVLILDALKDQLYICDSLRLNDINEENFENFIDELSLNANVIESQFFKNN